MAVGKGSACGLPPVRGDFRGVDAGKNNDQQLSRAQDVSKHLFEVQALYGEEQADEVRQRERTDQQGRQHAQDKQDSSRWHQSVRLQQRARTRTAGDGEARGERWRGVSDSIRTRNRGVSAPCPCNACVHACACTLRACVRWRSTMPSSSTIRSMSATIPLGPLLRIRAAS